ncbi:hypothetical protein [Ligilactobacillus aviarius]|uniref:hypothetical protein n=1 Tax=Ligilactobacillus aviarius TaxID=1606 RepID=UPI0024BA9FD1|nr:hypothetical protein [Ligilactobacillus aviarius]
MKSKIKIKLMKEYEKSNKLSEAQLQLNLINLYVNSLKLKDDTISLIYLGGRYSSKNDKSSIFLVIVNTYSFPIEGFNINFKIKIKQSKLTDVNLIINKNDLGILKNREGVPLLLNVPISGLHEDDFEAFSKDVEINIEKIRVRK